MCVYVCVCVCVWWAGGWAGMVVQEDHKLDTTQVSVHWTEEERSSGPSLSTTTHRKSLSAGVNLKGQVTLERCAGGGVWYSGLV